MRHFAKNLVLVALIMVFAIEPALAVDRTSLGLPCFEGVSEITAQNDGTFLVAGSAVERSQLKAALNSARKLSPSDCLQIVGRNPSDTDEVIELMKAFSPRPYKHVEWVYSRPVGSHVP